MGTRAQGLGQLRVILQVLNQESCCSLFLEQLRVLEWFSPCLSVFFLSASLAGRRDNTQGFASELSHSSPAWSRLRVCSGVGNPRRMEGSSLFGVPHADRAAFVGLWKGLGEVPVQKLTCVLWVTRLNLSQEIGAQHMQV